MFDRPDLDVSAATTVKILVLGSLDHIEVVEMRQLVSQCWPLAEWLAL